MSKRTAMIPERNGSIATFDLWFRAQLPALGYSTFFVKPSSSKSVTSREKLYKPKADITITSTVSITSIVSITSTVSILLVL